MRNTLYRYLLLLAVIVATKGIRADELSFNPLTKFRLESILADNSAVSLGSRHGINSPICVATSGVDNDDCYWYLLEYKKGKYAIRNAYSGQFLVFDDVRSDNPIRRYMHLDYNVSSDSALWTIKVNNDGTYSFYSEVAPTYTFNVRTGTYALGAYSQGYGTTSNNERFRIYKEDGEEYDSSKDYNSVCGIDKDGFYWSTVPLEHPVVYTTDDSNPVYYYITNTRSNLYVTPDKYLGQSYELPERRFYFKEVDGDVQIMVEGGGYVSAELPYYSVTSPEDVEVVEGTPAKGDHVWHIEHAYDINVAAYAIGVKNCSKNEEYNTHLLNNQIYWNDYSQIGICYYSVDAGSTFMFHTKDVRHRDYLAGLGLVIPSDSIGGGGITPIDPIDPVDPPVTDDTGLEPITGEIVHVYRADGKVDAIPQQYVQAIDRSNNRIVITTKNNGPQYEFADYEVDSISNNAPANLPMFNSFKFNNKFNRHLISDADGMFFGDSLIVLDAICIGKRLRPSFKIDDDVEVFIGNELQKSKETRTRYEDDVVYTIARQGQTILRRNPETGYVVYPYGRQTKVRVNFATDNSTGEYKVPTIYITTDNGTMINSKAYYWDAKITIDGAGVFPDMAETPMQIKGRGNSSWTSTGKAPYHMKFETAVKPFGLTKGKHWNLIANAQTRSMTSNAVAMKMAQLVETAGFNHEIPVELYINGEYRGSYNLTEKIGFSNNSIDLADETYAAMLELDSYYDETYKFRTSKYSLPVNIKEPDLSLGTSPLTSIYINQSFNRVTNALYNGEDMEPYLDLDYLARFLFVDELALNTEFMHPKSTYCYNENIMNSDSRYIFGPVWDFDWGYGYQLNSNYFVCSPSTDFWNCVSMEASTWTRDLRYCGENFDKKYFQLWHQFMNNGSLDELVEFCQDYYDFAQESFTHDNTKWYRGDAKTYAGVTSNAMTWLRNRANYIYNYMANSLGYSELGYLDDLNKGPLVGDVNGDGAITTADLVCVLNYILNLPNEDFEYDQADTDSNDMITIGDALAIRNLIAQQSIKSGRFYGLPEAEATLSTGIAAHSTTGITVPLTINVSKAQYSGLQFDLRIPAGMMIENLDINKAIPSFDMTVAELDNTAYADKDYDHYRVSIYSSANNTLPVGQSELELQLGWGYEDKAEGVLGASVSSVMFVNTLGEDERSGAYTSQFVKEELTGINSAVSLVGQNGNQITFRASENTVLPVYGADGRVFRLYNINAGTETFGLPNGVYIINKQKIIVNK